MDLSIDRRRLMLASLTLGASAGVRAQSGGVAPSATAAGATHPDLALKLMIVGRRRPGTTLAEHRHHIRRVHGELVLRNIAVDPANAPRRYVQNPVHDGSYRASAPGSDPFALNRDFVTQIWFPDVPTMLRARESGFYREHLQADENNFVDQASVVFLLTRERLRAGEAVPASGRVKLFGFVQRAAGASPDAFRTAWSRASWSVGAAGGPLRHVQNDTLPTPTGAPPVDGIDEFWFDDDAGAQAFLTTWQTWVSDALVRPGLAAPDTAFVLLAREDVIHAGPR